MIKCGKLAEPKSFALIVVRSFAMLIDDGVVLCDVVVAGISVSLSSCWASSSSTSSLISFSSWAKMRLWSMFIESTRSVFILRAKNFVLKIEDVKVFCCESCSHVIRVFEPSKLQLNIFGRNFVQDVI